MHQLTISEKILAQHCGKSHVYAGDIVEADVDYVMVNDVTGLPAFEVFEQFRVKPITERMVLIPDHYIPNKDVNSAQQAKAMTDFARKYDVKNYFEVGRAGICHQLMIEEGYVAPGRLIVGADSHTCSYGALGAFSTGVGSTEAAAVMATGKLWFKVPATIKFNVEGSLGKYVTGKDVILHIIGDIGVDGALYQAMEYYGSTFKDMPLADKISIANMTIEAGGKAGIFPPDDAVDTYLKDKVKGKYEKVYADEKAEYTEVREYNTTDMPVTVAQPSLPSNTIPASELDVEIDQAYLGSCTNGRIEDLRLAAQIIKGKKVKSGVRFIVVPASKRVFDQAMAEGLLEIFSAADAFISGPTCGACLGGYMGVLAEGEVAVSSTNRNFVGRMGHKDSKVYLANPAVVAASAITGKITDPNDLK